MNSTPRRRSGDCTFSRNQRRRLQRAIEAKVRHYERCLAQLGRVSPEVYETGMELFESEEALAQWLSEPAPSLGGRDPLRVMATTKGRSEVARILRALAHGTYL